MLISPFEQLIDPPSPRPVSAYDSAVAFRIQNISLFDNNGSSPTEHTDVPRVGWGVQLSDTGPVSSDVCQDHKGDPRLCKRGIRVILGSSIFLQGQLLRSLTVGLDTNKFISLEVESSDAIDNVKAEIQKGKCFPFS